MWRRVKWVVLWSLWAARVVRQPTPPVLVSNGWLRGSIAQSGIHMEYTGIPYASIEHTFQAPGPEPTWEGVFEAIDEHIRCVQWIMYGIFTRIGQRDCLILNVYTPLNPSPVETLPVMIFIHGGAFLEGSGSRLMIGPEFLTKKDIILVTLNYRVHMHGFLCLGIKEAPGNAGMKDQVAALKWVQRNIAAFGGNPNKVTLFGESAGGASVSHHILSPMSKGLFHKAITQSGSSLADWSLQYDGVKIAHKMVKLMGFNSLDPHELYKYFISRSDADIIGTKFQREEGSTIFSEIMFTPCVEESIEGTEPFLTELPYTLLSRGKYNRVPMIIGSNTEEGIFFINMEKADMVDKLNLEKTFPNDLIFPSNESRNIAVNKLRKLYLGDDEISFKNHVKLSKLYGEPYFNVPALLETELLVKTSNQPVYSYFFGYSGYKNFIKLQMTSDSKSIPGATHADDLFYLFHQNFVPLPLEHDIIEKMTTMWTNFAKYGDPTPEPSDLLPIRWPRVTMEDQKAYFIDRHPSIVPLWYSESLNFWKDLYSKYGRKSL